jgi:hypothetical protein
MKKPFLLIFGLFCMVFQSYSQSYYSTIKNPDINKCLEKISERDRLNERNKVIVVNGPKVDSSGCRTFWISSSLCDLKDINTKTIEKIIGYFEKAVVLYRSPTDTTKQMSEKEVVSLRDSLDSYLLGNKAAYKKMEIFIQEKFTIEERRLSKFPEKVCYTRECFSPKVTLCPNGETTLVYE